jgi:hypothetical protein
MVRLPGEPPKIYRPRIIEEHINAAMQMTAAGCNPFSVHLVVKACTRLIRDLAEHRGISLPGDYRDIIKKEFQPQYLALENKAYNFSKHADRDPEAPYDGPEPADLEVLNEMGTMLNIQGFRALDGEVSPAMIDFTVMMMAKYPQYLKEDAFRDQPEMGEQIRQLKPDRNVGGEVLRRRLAEQGLWPKA